MFLQNRHVDISLIIGAVVVQKMPPKILCLVAPSDQVAMRGEHKKPYELRKTMQWDFNAILLLVLPIHHWYLYISVFFSKLLIKSTEES